MAASRSAQTTEWVYHKTADGLHPDGHQQQPHWLMNRARAKCANEGRFPANRGHDDINFGISFSGVGTALLIRECAAIAPKPPAAFDRRRRDGRRARRYQSHPGHPPAHPDDEPGNQRQPAVIVIRRPVSLSGPDRHQHFRRIEQPRPCHRRHQPERHPVRPAGVLPGDPAAGSAGAGRIRVSPGKQGPGTLHEA